MSKNTKTFNIKETAETLVPDKLGRTSYLIGLIITMVMVAVIAFLYNRLPRSIPLYYSLPWGESRVARRIMIYLLPLSAMGFFVLNLVLGLIESKLSPLLPRVLAVAPAVMASMCLMALLFIIQSITL